MTDRVIGPSGGKRRSALLLAALASAVALGAYLVSNALAVHDEVFQLDGDVSASTQTNFGGHAQTVDWDTLFDAAGGEISPLPTGFDASSFDRDFNSNPQNPGPGQSASFLTSDDTTFSTGSKDTLPINAAAAGVAQGWECNQDNNVNSKIDVMNAYATSYTAGTQEFLYFALERNANTGTADVGFWFLQDPDAGCSSSPNVSTSFTGSHVDGDLLVVSEFTNGGTVTTINVYRWDGGANGSLNPNPVITNPLPGGADCRNAPLTGAGDRACGRTNTGTISTPWLTSNKQDGVGHDLRISEFYEGGINLTESNLGGKCFNTFIADTRSSTSLTATLFDYSLGQLGECTSETETTPSITSPTTIPADGTIDVTDNATVTVTGASDWSGTLKFFICGPIATGTCAPGTGDQLGDDQTVSDEIPSATSATATITEVGRYCFRAEFGGDEDADVPPSEDSRTTECFVITPRPTMLDTQAGASQVDFGQPVTDTATLTNTANRPGTGGIGANGSINPTTAGAPANGTIEFTLYKADCTTLATGTGTNPQTVTVSGDGTYGPVSFTPDAPGTYHWVARYSGDSPNTLASTHNTTCTDTDETVVVQQIPTAISTAQDVYPNDSATVSSTVASRELPAGGEIVFKLYQAAGGNTALANCLANTDTGLLYTETDSTVGGGGAGNTASTNNTTVAVDADATVYWRVTYDPKNTAFTGRQSACAESTAVDFTNDGGPGTLFP
jgi:hypothetical protein